MGSHISYSSDDDFLRISLNLNRNIELHKQVQYDLQTSNFIKISSFQINELDITLMKIKVQDIKKVFVFFNFNLFNLS